MNRTAPTDDDKGLAEHDEQMPGLAHTLSEGETGKFQEGYVADTLAGDYVDPTLVITEEENKRLKRKIMRHVLPPMMVAYVLQSLDKGTLGSSSIMGWQKNVGAKGQDYALTSTFLWVGVIVGEPIVNQLIRSLPVGKILAYSMLVWSALLFGLTFSLHVAPVFGIRFLLGLFESTFSPCLVTITVQWFRAEEQPLITTFWQLMFVAANFISSLLAYGFYSIHGATGLKTRGLYTWQWMTLCIACLSTLGSVYVIWTLPDSPVQAKWATPEEKVKFVERVRSNDQGIKQKKFRREQAMELLRDPLPWLLFLMTALQTLVVGGLNTFNSLLINQAFGFSVGQSQLLGMPLAAFQGCLYLLIGWLQTRTKQTVFCMTGYTIVNIIGSVVLITVAPSAHTKGGLLVCFYLMQCFQSLSPSLWAMLSRNVAGQTKKSLTYALFFIGFAGGNACGPQLFQAKWAPRYKNSLYIHIGVYIAFLADIWAIRTICIMRNKKRERMLEAQGRENVHAHAFEDRTDFENIEFRYSY